MTISLKHVRVTERVSLAALVAYYLFNVVLFGGDKMRQLNIGEKLVDFSIPLDGKETGMDMKNINKVICNNGYIVAKITGRTISNNKSLRIAREDGIALKTVKLRPIEAHEKGKNIVITCAIGSDQKIYKISYHPKSNCGHIQA